MNQNKILPQGLQIPDRQNQTFWLKAAGLALATALSFGLCWHLAALGFSDGQGLAFWVLPALAAALGVSFLSLLSIINPNKYLLWGVNFVGLIWYLLVFPKDWFVALGGLLFFLLSFLFESRIRDDEKTRADFSINRIMRSSVAVMVYGLLLIIGFNVYVKAKTEFESNPKRFFNQIGNYASRGLEYVPSGLGNFDPDQSFDDFVIEQAKRQNPEIESAPPSVRQQGLAELRRQLLERFNFEISGNPLLGQVVAGAISQKVEQSSANYQRFFPIIFAIIVVALLKTLSFVFVWLTYAVAWAIFRLLLLTKFFRIQKVQVEVNKLQI